MVLTAIVALDPDRVIGRAGRLPWHLPADLAFFRRTTTGHPVVMGRATFESIGRPLPGRRNIVLTRNPDWSSPGVEVIHSPAGLDHLGLGDARVFIIGGARVYQAFLPRLDELLVTHLRDRHPGDTFFPPYQQLFPRSEPVASGDGFEIRRHLRAAPSPRPPRAPAG